MSDPFSDIDNEVTIEKFKSFFLKFKVSIILVVSFLIFSILGLTFYNQSKTKKELKISNYYIEILSIIDSNKKQAITELENLAKLDKKSYKNFSNLLILKTKLEEKKLDDAIDVLENLEKSINSRNQINKIITYYYAQIFLDKKQKTNFENKINLLLSYGGMWAMFAYELRGHYLYSVNEYEGAYKNFNKIINNQQAIPSIKSRATEMINNINLYYEKNN